MINRNVLVGGGILLLVVLGFVFVSTMTGNVITGAAISEKVDNNEYFKISEFGEGENEIVVDMEVKNGA